MLFFVCETSRLVCGCRLMCLDEARPRQVLAGGDVLYHKFRLLSFQLQLINETESRFSDCTLVWYHMLPQFCNTSQQRAWVEFAT